MQPYPKIVSRMDNLFRAKERQHRADYVLQHAIVLWNLRCQSQEFSSDSPCGPHWCFSGPHCCGVRHNPSNPTPPALPANILPRGLARHGSGASSTHRLLNGPESPPWARLSRGGAINKCLRTPRPPPAFRGCNGSPQSTLTAFDKIPQEGRDWVNVFSEPRRGIFLGRPANPLFTSNPDWGVQQQNTPESGQGWHPLHSLSGQRSWWERPCSSRSSASSGSPGASPRPGTSCTLHPRIA